MASKCRGKDGSGLHSQLTAAPPAPPWNPSLYQVPGSLGLCLAAPPAAAVRRLSLPQLWRGPGLGLAHKGNFMACSPGLPGEAARNRAEQQGIPIIFQILPGELRLTPCLLPSKALSGQTGLRQSGRCPCPCLPNPVPVSPALSPAASSRVKHY